MSDIIEVPITIASAPGANYLCQVSIAATTYGPPSIQDNSYWFSVYDRSTLAQVFSVVQAFKADTVPADLAGKFNTTQYFLVVATRTLQSAYVPAGALHAFLVDSGSSTELKRLTQSYQQIGCGRLGIVTYAMAGVLGPGQPSHASVEASSISANTSQFLQATLLGIPVPTGRLYNPTPLTPPTP